MVYPMENGLEKSADMNDGVFDGSRLNQDSSKLSASAHPASIGSVSSSLKDGLAALEKKVREVNPKCCSRSEVDATFRKLGDELQLLQSSFGDSAGYLPAYDLRSIQNWFQNVAKLIAEKRDGGVGKESFTFRKSKPALRIASANSPTPDSGAPSEVLEKVNGTPRTEDASTRGTKTDIVNGTDHQNDFAVSGDQTACGFADRDSATLHLDKTTATDKNVRLSRLKNCRVTVTALTATLTLSDLTDCTILCGPVRTSIFVSNCYDCTIVAACQQLRVHDSRNLSCYVSLRSGGIIEHTKNARFAPYSFRYSGLGEDLVQAGFSMDGSGSWSQVQDFDSVVSGKRSPNISLIPQDERESFSPSFHA